MPGKFAIFAKNDSEKWPRNPAVGRSTSTTMRTSRTKDYRRIGPRDRRWRNGGRSGDRASVRSSKKRVERSSVAAHQRCKSVCKSLAYYSIRFSTYNGPLTPVIVCIERESSYGTPTLNNPVMGTRYTSTRTWPNSEKTYFGKSRHSIRTSVGGFGHKMAASTSLPPMERAHL